MDRSTNRKEKVQRCIGPFWEKSLAADGGRDVGVAEACVNWCDCFSHLVEAPGIIGAFV